MIARIWQGRTRPRMGKVYYAYLDGDIADTARLEAWVVAKAVPAANEQ